MILRNRSEKDSLEKCKQQKNNKCVKNFILKENGWNQEGRAVQFIWCFVSFVVLFRHERSL